MFVYVIILGCEIAQFGDIWSKTPSIVTEMPPKRKRMKRSVAQEPEDEVVEKKPKRKSQPKSKMPFMSLNDDCISVILGKLSLSNLCAVSKTCKRLQALATDQFMRYHKSKVLTINNVTENDDLVLWSKEPEFIQCFEKNIQNVTFGKALATKPTLRAVNKVYRLKNSAQRVPIKTLRIDGWTRGLRMTHRPSLVNLVKDVESLTISNTKIYGDLNECLLKHIPNLKRLTLWQKIEVEPGADPINWMEQTYPKLEYFAWHSDKKPPPDDLNRFFELNPNINFFSLHSNSPETIGQLLNEGIHIDELYIDIRSTSIPVIFNDLRVFCEQQQCKRLHLKFADSARPKLNANLGQFILLGPYIEGLYFEKNSIDPHLARTIITFDQLKVMQLNIAVNADILSQAPNLEEIFAYWGVDKSNFKKYQEAMTTYAKNTRTLKKIYLRNNSQPFERFEFHQLDEARKELADAKKLKIYFKTEDSHLTGKLSAVKCDFDMVEVVRVETEHVVNPLITEYLTTKQLSMDPYLNYLYGR